MFNLKIHCVVFSTNINLNKRFVLSSDPNNIVFPCFDLSIEHLKDINHQIIEFLKSFVFVSDLELLPQIINIHHGDLSENPNDINTVYGFIINHTDSLNNAHWIEFELLKEQKISPVLFEVIQKLR
jgi:hypothetical protein